jgi:hypothetical protein
MLVKQFGLQRSGTNALRALIEHNTSFSVASMLFGNKHDCLSWSEMDHWAKVNVGQNLLPNVPYEYAKELLETRSLPILISIKDPVSWLASYYRYQRKKINFSNPGNNFEFSSSFSRRSLEFWNSRVESYLNFTMENETGWFMVQHEQLLTGPKQLFESICSFLCVEPPSDPDLFIDGYAKRGIEADRGAGLINRRMKFDREYHLNGSWLKEIPLDALGIAIDFRDQFFDQHPDALRFFPVQVEGLTVMTNEIQK